MKSRRPLFVITDLQSPDVSFSAATIHGVCVVVL